MSPLVTFALRLGDNALVLGQRLGERVGHAPALELEMAVANLALDRIGEAQLWLDLAGEVEGRGRTSDDLAYGRDVMDFRNLLLVEQPDHDWAWTIARHLFHSLFQKAHFAALEGSADPRVAEIAAKTGPEIAYHLRFARDWLLRLGDGTAESHARMQAAVDALWKFTGEMFVTDAVDHGLIAQGIAVDTAALEAGWREELGRVFADATLEMPGPVRMWSGGRDGEHGEHLGHLLAELQALQRTYPGLAW